MGDRLARDPQAIRAMFEGAAGRYDLLNRLLSLRQDVGWRRRLIASLAAAPAGAVLDLATGTGDVAFAIKDRPAVGADFTLGMLVRAHRKATSLRKARPWVAADALALPFRDGRFAAVTIAFGVRNFVDLEQGLREMRRVLVAGGLVAVLELHRPRHAVLARLAAAWNRLVVTPLGRLLSGDGSAYAYLPASIDTFPDLAALGRRIGECGLELMESVELSGGVAGLTVARRVEEL
jgi:demethylmenaquinone methyltransferase / 2-methoxy-6-polyprenyl-1,4-benzoquinol methylase